MKTLLILAAICAASILSGCRSVEVENYGQDYVRLADGNPVLVDGKPVLLGKGWRVDHFQHWMITRADALTADVSKESISFALNGLNTQPDADGLSSLVDKSLSGAANLAAKVGAAVATSGGSIGADAIAAYVKKFIDKGGNPDAAYVTISDGKLTCTDGSCTLSEDCPDGSCTL